MANTAFAFSLQTKPVRMNSKSAPQLPPIQSSIKTNTDDVNLSKVVVITKNDLERITGHLDRRQKEKEAVLEEMNRKNELHQKSLALTQGWNNTIQGSRRKKLEQKKFREEKDEEERRQVDLEHAKYMADERKKALDQAKLLQYYETDKIKTFHSALKLTEVLKEREAQLEMKKLLENLHKEQEAEEYKQSLATYQDQLKEEMQLEQKKRREQDKLTQYHKAQIEKHMEQIKQSKEESLKEGDLLRHLSDQYNFEREQLERIQEAKTKELKSTYDKAIENKMKMAEAEKMMDEEENEEIRVYASAKKKMAKMRREKEIEIWREKQENREKMMGYLGSLLKEQEADEDFRIAKAVQKREMKLALEEKQKNEKMKQMADSIAEHRTKTIKNKKIMKEQELKENEEEMKKRMEADQLYHIYESEKSRQRQKNLDLVAKMNLKKTKERRDDEKNTRIAEKEFVKQELKLMDLEDKQFEDYATRVIDYMDKHGRNTYPMKKVLNNHSENTQNQILSEAAQIKQQQNEVPTNKNLGFN